MSISCYTPAEDSPLIWRIYHRLCSVDGLHLLMAPGKGQRQRPQPLASIGVVGVPEVEAPFSARNTPGLTPRQLHTRRKSESPPPSPERVPLIWEGTAPWPRISSLTNPPTGLPTPHFRVTERYLKAQKRRTAIKYTSTLLLCLLFVFCGFGWFLSQYHDLLDESLPPPIVRLDYATFVGKSQGQTETFQGIPYARPPVGKLRLRKPEPLPPYTGRIFATRPGFSCPQTPPRLVPPDGLSDRAIGYTKVIKAAYPDSEDCLNLDVIRPAGTTPDSKFPVVVWFFGGGLQFGGTSRNSGVPVVVRSVEIETPIIFVAMNYRLNAFGFLAGKEVKAAGVGNLGLRDQREALRWVQKHIAAFGGDPTKVTLWGQSAGGISVGSQIVTNQGENEGLFRGVIMQSGSPHVTADILSGQRHYDRLVDGVGCTGAADTLDCLRGVPYEKLKQGVEDMTPGMFTYQGLSLTWPVTVDDDFLSDTPLRLVQTGSVAQVPVLIGNVEDEGTLFALGVANITTDVQAREYVREKYMESVPDAEVDRVMNLYPNDPTQGSPFNTGERNQLSPQFKRMAAIIGDMAFIAPRRFFAQSRSDKQPVYGFVSERFKGLEYLGAAHSSDLVDPFGGGVTADYFIQFTTHMDPNGHSASSRSVLLWPKYSNELPSVMRFFHNDTPLSIGRDDYREEALSNWNRITLGEGFPPA